jgi:hypothetical protein
VLGGFSLEGFCVVSRTNHIFKHKNLSLRSSICFFDFFSYTELLRDICPSCRSMMETILLEMAKNANLRLRG